MHTGGSLLAGDRRESLLVRLKPTASDPGSPAVPSDPRLRDTQCAVLPGMAAWKRHTEDHVLCSE